MHDLSELAAEALYDFYCEKGGLKTICFELPEDQGKAFNLAAVTANNVDAIILALEDTSIQARFEQIELTKDDFSLFTTLTFEEVNNKKLNKNMRLSKLTRKTLQQHAEVAEFNVKEIEFPPLWLRVPNGEVPPENAIENVILENFYRIDNKFEAPEGSQYISESLSSGLPVACLCDYFGSNIGKKVLLDACAAPGSKTLEAAECFETVLSNERDRDRFEILEKRCCKCKNIKLIRGDAFETFKEEAFDCILLDPTCSGSGTFNLDRRLAEKLKCLKETAKLEELTKFEVSILSAALDTNCEVVSYSTCSINKEENEDVVEKCLAEHPEYELVNALPEWKMRSEYNRKCITSGEEEHSEGFFVALFEKK